MAENPDDKVHTYPTSDEYFRRQGIDPFAPIKKPKSATTKGTAGAGGDFIIDEGGHWHWVVGGHNRGR